MTTQQIANSVAYCGLVCGLCRPDGGCDCRSANQCGKQLSPKGCFQHDCCIEKGYAGCWECPDFPCGKDMQKSLRVRTFVQCIREDGLKAFAGYILRNQENGVIYHYEGSYSGDYELDTEEAMLRLLRTGEQGRGAL